MLDFLRAGYSRLPVIRELRRLDRVGGTLQKIARQLESLQQGQQKLIQERMDSYEGSLLASGRYADPANLTKFERSVFSQFGQDGIIAEAIRRVGAKSRTFVEIGIGTGVENNTVYLLLQGWSGVWIEGSEQSVELVRRRFSREIAEGRLKVVHSHVTAENVKSLIEAAGVPAEPDVLSLDIDRNTYWAWAALTNLRPRLAVIEYNSHFPPEIDWKVDYEASAVWKGTMYYGASLKALEELGSRMGYCLVGCTLSGVDAFFVRKDLCEEKFERPFTAARHFEPYRHFLERARGFRHCFDDLRDFE